MRVLPGSQGVGAGRSLDDPPDSDILVPEATTAAHLRLLTAAELHPTSLGKRQVDVEADPAMGPRTPNEADVVSPPFAIRGQSRARVARLQLSGHLGLDAGPLVQVWLAQVELAAVDLVVLDLRNLTSMDDAGFLICLRAWGHARLCGLGLILANCRGDARRLLEVTGTGELFGAAFANGSVRASEGIGWSAILIPQVCRDQ